MLGGASGSDTPGGGDKPQVYCTEGTPGYFSRADSISSLDSADMADSPPGNQGVSAAAEFTQRIEELGEEKGQLEANMPEKQKEDGIKTPPPMQATVPGLAASGRNLKSVTFNAQETPLMFSRASSFESLTSFYQHSVKDGYSSCDFSRATSGRVSPSDLPDSPGHSRPRTPQQQLPKAKLPPPSSAEKSNFPLEEERKLPSAAAAALPLAGGEKAAAAAGSSSLEPKGESAPKPGTEEEKKKAAAVVQPREDEEVDLSLIHI